MRDETEAALVETELCWSLSYYQSLEIDEESKACGLPPPADHWHVTIIVSLEDTAEGWGATSDAAAFDALSKFEAMHFCELGDDLVETSGSPDQPEKWTH